MAILNRELLSSVRSKINTVLAAVGNYVTLTGTQTLTNKTLTNPVINNATGINKDDVGLDEVDNTSDADKIISDLTQTALDAKQDENAASTLFETMNARALDYTLAITDKNNIIRITNAGATLFNIPLGLGAAANELPIGSTFTVENSDSSTNNVTVTPAGSVTFLYNTTIVPGQSILVKRVATNVYARLSQSFLSNTTSTADYTVSLADWGRVVIMTVASADKAFNLPASMPVGMPVYVHNRAASSVNVLITGTGGASVTYSGALTGTIAAKGTAFLVKTTATEWIRFY